MKIVIDDKIPYITGVLEPIAEVKYLAGSKITREDIIDADCLIIRTRTHCDRNLLHGSNVKFIATATIGYDHIDTDYCKTAGIEWTNAPGCNSESVNQYIASALSHWSIEREIPLTNLTMGIVGVGNVGSKVAKTAEHLGLNVLLNDPPRARKEGPRGFVDIKKILEESHIISLHVPLNRDGVDKTFHLADGEFIKSWKEPYLFLNTCRGEVMDSNIINKSLEEKRLNYCIIDCWENEPEIDLSLLKKTLIGTPHIAGYSRDGKANGTTQCIRAISKYFDLDLDDWSPKGIEKPHFPTILLNGDELDQNKILFSAIQSTYDISHDDKELKLMPLKFEFLRGNYPVRREFGAFSIKPKNITIDTENKLRQLGFKISK